MAVYPIPTIPNKEKGASAERDFIQQSGNRIQVVRPSKMVLPALERSKVEKVSVKIMEYAKHDKNVIKTALPAGIQAVSGPTVRSQAC